jgi:hypothetical protein
MSITSTTSRRGWWIDQLELVAKLLDEAGGGAVEETMVNIAFEPVTGCTTARYARLSAWLHFWKFILQQYTLQREVCMKNYKIYGFIKSMKLILTDQVEHSPTITGPDQ